MLQSKVLSEVVCAVLVSATLFCCALCWQRSLTLRFPLLVCAFWLFLLWLVFVISLRLFWRSAAESLRLPSGTLLLWFVPLVALGCIATGQFPFFGAFISASIFAIAFWLLHSIWRAAVLSVAWLKRGEARGAAAFHSIWVLAVVGFGLHAQATAKSTERLAAYLDTSPYDLVGVVVPELVARGEEAVQPIIEVLERTDIGAGKWELWPACYCLAAIDGPEAERYLAESVKRAGRHASYTWRFVFAAYAQCARERAVPSLLAAYRRVGPRDRWSVLVALVKTGAPEAIAFVFEHIDVLFEGAESGAYEHQLTARLTLQTLLSDPDPDAVRRLPVFRNMSVPRWFIRDSRHRQHVFALCWLKDDRRRIKSTAELRKLWKDKGAELQRAWRERFQQALE